MIKGPPIGLENKLANLTIKENEVYQGEKRLEYFEFEDNDKADFAKILEQNFQEVITPLTTEQADLKFALQNYHIDLQKVLKSEKNIDDLANLSSKLYPLLTAIKKQTPLDVSNKITPLKILIKHLLLLSIIVRYNSLVFEYNLHRNNFLAKRERLNEKIIYLKNEFVSVDFFINENEDKNSLHKKIMKQCFRGILTASSLFEPNWMGVNELIFHINRKNKAKVSQTTTYHAECIYNPDCFTMSRIDSYCINQLISKMDDIQALKQSRTQFIIYVDGIHHALVMDISWNTKQNQFEIICVESTSCIIQHNFLESFRIVLVRHLTDLMLKHKKPYNYQIIGILTGLQKNFSSCATFSLALSSELSKTSFAQLLECENIPQPKFHTEKGYVDLINLKILWRSVTSLGLKAVLMGQSFTDMTNNLNVLYPKKPKVVAGLINMVKTRYQLNEGSFKSFDETDETEHKSYIHYRREGLRKQTQLNPNTDLSIELITQKTQASSHDHAFRICAKEGPAREFKFLLENLPQEDIHKKGNESQRNALHFAYMGNKPERVRLLSNNKVDSKAKDKEGKIPSDYKCAILRG